MAQNVYTMIITYTTGPQFAQSVTHWQFDDSGYSTTKGAAEALQIAWDTARRAVFKAMLPTDVVIKSYKGQRVSATGGFEAFTPVTSGGTGTRPGTQSATALNPVIVSTSIPLTRGRGKFFMPGVSETDIEDGKYTEAYKTAMAALLTTMFDDVVLSGGGAPTAVYGWLDAGNNFHVADNVWLSLNLGTQRRRMRPA